MLILVFGDSITCGAWDKEGGWADRLKQYLFKKSAFGKKGYCMLYNLGIDGDTTAGVLARLENEIKFRRDRDPAEELVLIFEIGSNDTRYMHSKKAPLIGEKQFEQNIKEIIRISKIHSDKILFLGMEPVDEKKVDPIPWTSEKSSYKNKILSKYNLTLKKFCAKEGVYFLDLQLLPKSYLKTLDDGIHPNTKGHEMLFEAVKKFMEKEKIV